MPPGAELRKALKEDFERRFGIELELVTGRGSAIVKKIADEHRAGVQFFDIHTGGSGTIMMVWPASLIPSRPSLSYRRSRTRKTGGGVATCTWTKPIDMLIRFWHSCRRPFGITRSSMKAEEVHSYDDLLQTKWTGKIGYSDPRAGGAGQGNSTFLWKTKGEEFLKKLVQQKLVIMREERLLAE